MGAKIILRNVYHTALSVCRGLTWEERYFIVLQRLIAIDRWCTDDTGLPRHFLGIGGYGLYVADHWLGIVRNRLIVAESRSEVGNHGLGVGDHRLDDARSRLDNVCRRLDSVIHRVDSVR